MAKLVVFLLVVFLLVAGWNQSFKDRYDEMMGNSPSAPPPTPAASAQTQPAPPQARAPQGARSIPQNGVSQVVPTPVQIAPPDRSWMFKKSTLDTPHTSGLHGGGLR